MRISDWSSDVCSSDLERVGAHAVVDVDVVEAAGLLLQQHFGRTGRRDSNVFVAKDFGTARFVNADSLDHQARCSLKKLIVRSFASLAEAASYCSPPGRAKAWSCPL